jgi:hypothetical protein
VKVTVLEPGGMRTDRANSSMTIPKPSAPCHTTIGAFDNPEIPEREISPDRSERADAGPARD